MLGKKSNSKRFCRVFSILFVLDNLVGVNISSKQNLPKNKHSIKHEIHKSANKVISKSISELNSQKEKIKKAVSKFSQILKKEKESQKSLTDEIHQLEKDIDKINESIYITQEKIKGQEKEITNLEQLKMEKKDEMKVKSKELGKYLRAIHTVKTPNFYEICFKSRGFEDFIDKLQILNFLMKKISCIVNDIKKDIKKIEESINQIEKIKKDCQNIIYINEKQKLEVKSKIANLDKLYEESEKKQKEARIEIDNQNNELKKIESEIDAYYESLRKKSAKENAVYVPKFTGNKPRLLWPVKGFRRITSNFFDSVNRRSSHGAIDIGSDFVNGSRRNIYGAEVRAPIDMLILYSADGCNGGYGNYIVATFECNKNRYQIYFGHLSRRVKSKGQKVNRGEIIGYVGNTGYSTGPHLHFEIRENGVRIDPFSFPYDY